MIKDAQVSIILTQQTLFETLPESSVLVYLDPEEFATEEPVDNPTSKTKSTNAKLIRANNIPDYADFTIWQQQWFSDNVFQSQLDYWKQQLGGELPLLDLPTDHPRPPVQTYRGAKQSFQLSKELTDALKALSRREGVTLFITLLTAFKTLLYRYTGQEDIIVCSPIANRNQTEIERLIGFFVNTLVLRSDLSGTPSFRQLLGRVRKVALEAYANSDVPFEKLLEELQPERSLSHTPIFQVWFNMLNFADSEFKLSDLKVESF